MRKHWHREQLPTHKKAVFPDEGDTLDCSCGLKMGYLVVGEEEGAGFMCSDCGHQVWCYLEEDPDDFSDELYWEDEA